MRSRPTGAIEAGATWGLKAGDALGEDRHVLTFVAAGRKSEVYLAWDRRRHSMVAAKLPRPGRPVRKLHREAALLDRLAHPVLVRSYGAALEERYPHLVLEHIAGPSVRRLMRREAIAPDMVVAVALQVATALHYLAMEGFVHLDVNPHNILLDTPTSPHTLEAGRRERHIKRVTGAPPPARLIDAAAIQPVGSVVKALGGSVPELRVAEARAAPPAGVWLLGATMWRMLSGGGKVPGEEVDPRERRARNLPTASMDPPVRPEGAPKPLVDLVTACLRREPSERPSAGEVAERLEPLFVSSFATPSSPPQRRPAARLRRWLVPSGG